MNDDDYPVEEVDSFEGDNLVVPENPRELEEYRDRLLAMARSLKEKNVKSKKNKMP
jgi:hypothetical protein